MPRPGSNDLGMHGTAVLDFLRTRRRGLAIQRHATFWTGAWARLTHHRAHGANVVAVFFFGMGYSARGGYGAYRSTQRNQLRSHRLGRRRQNLFGICVELCETSGGAEGIILIVMDGLVTRGGWIYIHSADGVLLFLCVLIGRHCGVDRIHCVDGDEI